MVFPIAGGTQSTGYEISNSLRFNDDDSASMAITPGSAGNRKTWTYSGWVKRSASDSSQDHIFMVNGGSADDTWVQLRFEDDDFTFSFYNQRALRTDRKFRDTSAWYHIVVAVDTTQGTDSNRIKIYVNGVQETSFSVTNYPSQDSNTGANGTYRHFIGAEGGTSGNGSGNFYDGYMTEVNLVDGTALDPTSFGEFNDNGVWIPKKYTGSYGTNGFFLEFKQTGTSQNSSGIGADTSGNDNHFSVNGLAATDITEDTCTNNFATFNPLFVSRFDNDGTLSEGNCQSSFNTNANRGYAVSTLAVTQGKWYWEVKVTDTARMQVGVCYPNEFAALSTAYYDNNPSQGFGLDPGANISYDATSTTYGSTISANDIVMMALDMDNHLIWAGLNGSWFNSATVSEIEAGTATNDMTTKMGTQQNLNSGEPVAAMVGDVSTTESSQFQINFGNPPYAISSGNNDGKYGNFEYAPPSGFYALCTKRLAEFGG